MFYVLLSFIFLFPVFTGVGKIFKNLFMEGISGKLLMGIFTIATLWTVLSFFIPLNTNVEIATISISYFLFFYHKGHQDWVLFFKGNKSWFLLIIVLFILGMGSLYPYILDHFGYYVPSIKWLSEVGLVKGIANLDLILGQMSVWHIFQAGFSHLSDPFLRINALLLIVYAIYIFERKVWFQLCFIPVLVAFTPSPSPDLPVIVFSLIILTEILKRNENLTLLFGISCFVFTIKPTAIWLPLFCLLYGIFVAKKHLKFTILGFIISILFIVKNIWTFGYPFFPIQILDLNVAWKANPDLLQQSSQLALEKTYDLQYSYQEITHFSWQEKIIRWFTLEGIKGKIHLLFILTLMILIVFSFWKKEKIYRLLWLSIFIKSMIVLIFSAQYRFFLEVFFVAGMLFFEPFVNEKKSKITSGILAIFSIIIFIFPTLIQQTAPSFRLGYTMKKAEWKMLYQPLHYTYNNYQTFTLGNLKFNVSKNYPFSFDTPLPAISPSFIQQYSEIGIFPQKSKNGFIWKKLTPKEKQDLKAILKEIQP